MPEVILSRTYISFFHTKVLLISSCWNAINSLGNILLAGMSMILSNVLYGVLAAGSYAIVNIVPQFVNGVIIMISGVFYPIITYKYAQNNKNELLKTIKTAQICVGIFGCSVISVFCSLATDFFTLWTPNENSIYLSFLTFLTILPHFSIACMWSLTNMNVVLNKVKTPAIYTLMSGVINVLVSILIYKLWAPGVASLPLISSFLQIIWIDIFIPLYACKNLGVKWNSFYPVLIKALFCSGLIIIIISNVKTFFLLDTWPKLILYSGISELIALFVFTLVLFGFKYILVVLKTHYS
jgi:O-antigen/teichoic acid export membrane protein